VRRDRQMVTACCQALMAVLVLTDSRAAYPHSMRRACRENVTHEAGRGRNRMMAWPPIVSGTVSAKTAKKRVVDVIGRVHVTFPQW